MRFSFLLLAGAALSGCATLPVTPAATLAPTAHHASGMVSAADPRGAEAGAEMLRAGGSAADAIGATLLALTVVEPQSSGIGGGGFLVYDNGGTTPDTYDGRETAPAAARGEWFFVNGKALEFPDVIPGGRSVGVPGNVRMLALAHAKEGRLPWARLFDPAIRLARDGFAITPRLALMLEEGKRTAAWTGENCVMWCGSESAPGVSVAGNMLAGAAVVSDTLSAMLDPGPLPERLARAMLAGERAGGDRRGRQSAAMVLTTAEDFPDLNLRVDDHADPIAELDRLVTMWRRDVAPGLAARPGKANPSGVTALDEIEAGWIARGLDIRLRR